MDQAIDNDSEVKLPTLKGKVTKATMAQAIAQGILPDKVNKTLAMVAEGATMHQACKANGLSVGSVLALAAFNPELSEAYSLAKQIKLESEAEKLLELADSIDTEEKTSGNRIKKAQLQINARQWLLARLISNYSDKQQVDVSITCDIGERLRSGIGRVEKEVN